ncbi:MAG: AmmeMemoRadiSam system protein B [Geminicoccaceae bacterium]
MGAIRPPAVAGTFYPAVAGRLHAAVGGFLAAANGSCAEQRPKALIAPHAGYVYSGAVAGHAFAALGEAASQIRRVVVIGPAHYVPFRGIAAPRAEAFRTPLGDVPLDRAAIAGILDLPQIALADAPHRPEHAIEVELPFLQVVLGELALVPILVGDATGDEVAGVLGRLWDGPETLIVISSDLSHYEAYASAKEHDGTTAAAIERFDDAALGPRDACGYLPIAGLLVEARRRGMRIERLDLRNSGDTAGPKDQVVGYGAWAFCEA